MYRITIVKETFDLVTVVCPSKRLAIQTNEILSFLTVTKFG